MSDKAESPASRLWRDQVQLREHERDEARAEPGFQRKRLPSLRLRTTGLRMRSLGYVPCSPQRTQPQPVPRRNSRWRTLEPHCCPSWISRAGSNLRIWLPDRFGLRIDFTPDPVVVKLLFEEKRNPRNQTTRLRECPALKRMAGLIGRSSPFKIRFLVFSHAPSAAEVMRADPLRDRRFAVQHAAQMLNVLTNILKTSTISLNLPLYRQLVQVLSPREYGENFKSRHINRCR